MFVGGTAEDADMVTVEGTCVYCGTVQLFHVQDALRQCGKCGREVKRTPEDGERHG